MERRSWCASYRAEGEFDLFFGPGLCIICTDDASLPPPTCLSTSRRKEPFRDASATKRPAREPATAEVGRTKWPVRDGLRIAPGAGACRRVREGPLCYQTGLMAD